MIRPEFFRVESLAICLDFACVGPFAARRKPCIGFSLIENTGIGGMSGIFCKDKSKRWV